MADKNIPDLPALLASDLVGGSVMEWYDATSSTNRKMTYTQLATIFASAPPFTDTNTLIKGSSDTTKLMRFEIDGFTTGTTRVLTPPDSNATLAGINIDQTFTGVQTFTPVARSSGSASAFTFNTPADTGTTASTERIVFNVVPATVTWATGNVTTQRFNVWGADTVAAAGASTFTTVVGNEFLSPMAGTNTTITNCIGSRFVASAATCIPLVAKGANSQTANLQEWQNSSGTVLSKVNSSGQIVIGGVTLDGTQGITFSNTWGIAGGLLPILGSYIGIGTAYSSYTLGIMTGASGGLTVGAAVSNSITPTGTLDVIATGAARIGQVVKGAASATADALQIQNSSGTALYKIGAPAVQTTGSPTFITATPPAHTTLTASTEAIDVNYNLARTVQFSTGALTTQRAFVIQAPTYGFAGSSTITTAVGLEVNSPSAGTNATITKSIAAKFVASSAAHVPVQIKVAASATGNALEIFETSAGGLQIFSIGSALANTGVFGYNGFSASTTTANGNFTWTTGGYNSSGFTCDGKLSIAAAGSSTGYGVATDYPFDSNRTYHRITGGSSTYATWYANHFGIVTLSGHSATQTVTDVATVKIDGLTIAGASQAVTITNNWALWVAAGPSRFDAGAAETSAAIYRGAASRTAPLIQLQTSAGGSLGNVGGCIFDDFTDAATTHTDGTEDTLCTHTTVANTLAVNGDKIVAEYVVAIVGSATATRRIQGYFAGTSIGDTTALTYATSTNIIIRTTVIRVTSTTARASMEVIYGSGITRQADIFYTDLSSLTLTSTNIFKITGIAASTGAASGDITCKFGTISVIPAGS